MLKLFLLLASCCFMTASGAVSQPEPLHVIVINPGLSAEYTSFGNWGDLIESSAIYEWGRSHNLYMQLDSPPLVDHKAGYIPPGGVFSAELSGLKRDSRYAMWIDFVAFKNPESASFPSLLKIFVKNDYYLYRELAAFSFENIPLEPVKIAIPFELSEAGRIYILFEEYDAGKTFGSKTMWGIWDIIVTDADSIESLALPKPEKKAMPYKTDILR